MTVEEMSGPPFGVFSDNWLAAKTFARMDTQWRVGMAGPYGLDYGVLYRKMDRMNLVPVDYDQLEEDIAVMERAALRKMENRR